MSLKEGPGKPIEDAVMLEILEDVKDGKAGAKERLCDYIIDETKRTGVVYSHWFFEGFGMEEPQAYRDAVDEYYEQKNREYEEKKRAEEQLRKEKRDKIQKRLMGISIIILLLILVIVCIFK